MSHFARIDENNIVVEVIVGDNDAPNEGADWIAANLPGRWVKSSYNTWAGEHLLGGVPLRKNRAEVGFTYDENRDAFIPPKPYDSWVLDENTCQWTSPVTRPRDGKKYSWDEAAVNWVQIQE